MLGGVSFLYFYILFVYSYTVPGTVRGTVRLCTVYVDIIYILRLVDAAGTNDGTDVQQLDTRLYRIAKQPLGQ